MSRWYYECMGEPAGPVSSKQLLLLTHRGVVAAGTIVWDESDGVRIRADEVAGLFEAVKRLENAKRLETAGQSQSKNSSCPFSEKSQNEHSKVKQPIESVAKPTPPVNAKRKTLREKRFEIFLKISKWPWYAIWLSMTYLQILGIFVCVTLGKLLLPSIEKGGGVGIAVGFVVWLFSVLIFIVLVVYPFLISYFIPAIVAKYQNHHPQTQSIFIVNLFFGWTFLGWVISLAWALSNKSEANDRASTSIP